MQLSERRVDGVLVIDVSGDLIVNDNPGALRAFVRAAIDRGERQIVLNVARLRRIDSSCLGEIIASYSTATRCGGVLKLAQPDAHFHRLLQLTRLTSIIETFDTELEAVQSIRPEGSRLPT